MKKHIFINIIMFTNVYSELVSNIPVYIWNKAAKRATFDTTFTYTQHFCLPQCSPTPSGWRYKECFWLKWVGAEGGSMRKDLSDFDKDQIVTKRLCQSLPCTSGRREISERQWCAIECSAGKPLVLDFDKYHLPKPSTLLQQCPCHIQILSGLVWGTR